LRVSLHKQRHAIWQKEINISFLLPIFILLTSVITVLLVTLTPASAATSSTLNFQGRLLTNTGGLVPDGSYNIEFKIYDDPAAGTNWWTENRTGGSAVTVRNGYFSVYLGEVTPFSASIPWDQDLWMTMNVNADGEMSPRFKLTAVPYALRAGAVTDSAGNAYTGDDLIQKSPATIQAVNSALAAIRLNQAGAGGFLQFQQSGTDVLTVDNSGNTAVAGAVTSGTASQAGSLILEDGGGNSLTLNPGSQSGDLTFTFPVTYGISGQCLQTNGSGILSFGDCGSGGGGGAVGTTAVKSVDQTINNNNTLFNDADLNFAVGANETWSFRFVLQGNSATQPDFQFAVSAPAGSTCSIAVSDPEGATSISNLGCGVSSGVILGNGADDLYEVTGTVITSGTAGTVNLQWAQNTSNANNTTIYAGSYVFATAEGAASGGGGTAFEQGGNAFAGTATLGTTDSNGLNIITNGGTRLGFTSAGDATFSSSLTVSSGGLTLSGGLDNNSGGITEAGAISGLISLSGSGALSISSGGSGSLTLDSASDVLMLADSTLQRTASGTTVIDLLDAGAGTTLSILNSSGTQVAGLIVEGSITSNSFSGNGSGLTSLDGSNISTGTIADGRLSSNVVLLDQSQIFTGLPTFSEGLILGTSTSTTSGTIRWSGTDFEGYDGLQWLSLTSGGGGGGGGSTSPALTTVNKTANEVVNNSATLQDDNHLFFSVGASETWTYRFVIQANTPIGAGIKFAVTAPSGSTCQVAFIDQQTASSESGIGCGAASTTMIGTGANEVYEIVGTIVNGANPGNVTLQWAQGTAIGSNTTVLAGSYLNASIDGGGQVFLQNGNAFGGTAIIGTTDSNPFNLIAGNSTALSLATDGTATFTGEILANGGITIGNASGDGLTIVSDSVTVTNGLNFDSNTFVIDSANNRVGIGTATTNNLLTINDATTADSSAQVLLATGTNTNKGLVIQGELSQSANLLELQNDSGVVLGGFNSGGGLVLGLSTITSTASGSQTVSFGDESGTVCLSGSTNCGFLSLATGSFITDSTTNNTIAINKTGASGNLLALQKNGGAVFTVANTGSLQIQSTDSAALDIRNVGGTSYFSIDTNTGIVRVGQSTTDANGVLFVLDTKNTSGDPTGIDGGQYYNSSSGKFRCFENSVWKDCITTGLRSFIDTVSDPLIDANTTDYWDIGAENNNSVPNINWTSTSGNVVYGTVTFELTSGTAQDVEATARVVRNVGSAPSCTTSPAVGGNPGLFATNSGAVKSSTVTFIDTPPSSGTVYYTLCSDAATAGNLTANITRIRITLQEVTNSN
jgi:hypothetical protein